ncbi:MAG: alkaline phosphatase family protein, partial [Candidatus Peregrinibacteria bacterium]|nr:alkaline phosphatase family protein [Candidatus Peregrinibacteria bacterium]
EKYAHVTYFFNSQVETPKPLEDRKMVKSPKCASYADQPEMSAVPLTDALIKEIEKDSTNERKYRFIAVNYANTDLVGHSGEFKAAVKSSKIIDQCLSKLIPTALKHGYDIFLTADHGNAEQMFYENGEPCPSHTKNPVIGLLVSKTFKNGKLKKGKGLQDVAPTLLDILNVDKPDVMTGESLISS